MRARELRLKNPTSSQTKILGVGSVWRCKTQHRSAALHHIVSRLKSDPTDVSSRSGIRQQRKCRSMPFSLSVIGGINACDFQSRVIKTLDV
ncbi:hypothetical protein TNCV_40411 [Trichonephila clavipes]|nr:hypothetical protein TNCV_40411 [Trichonephila clavipes]